MHTSWLTAEQYAVLSSQPQAAFIAPLPAFDCLSIDGVDNRKYLQGQTTCDVNSLTDSTFLHGAHCDAKGKMWSQFYLLADAEKLIAIAFRDEMAASYAQWKKFGVFSKVSFEPGQSHFAVFGVSAVGDGAHHDVTNAVGQAHDQNQNSRVSCGYTKSICVKNGDEKSAAPNKVGSGIAHGIADFELG